MHSSQRATLAARLRVGALLALAATSPIAAQQQPIPSASGREFWLVFQKNFRDFVTDERSQAQVPAAELTLQLSLAASVSTPAIVEIPALRFRTEVQVGPGRVTIVDIPKEAQLLSSGIVEHLAVHVKAEQPITVYGLNHRFQSTDTYLGIPVGALGRAYRAAGYRQLQQDLISQLAIVATEDNTVVRIVPNAVVMRIDPEPIAIGATSPSDAPQSLVVRDGERVAMSSRPAFSYDALRRAIVVPSMKSRTRTETKGVVVARVAVEPDGSARSVTVIRSDRPQYDRFVVDALGKFSYAAMLVDDAVEPTDIEIPVDVAIDNFGGEPSIIVDAASLPKGPATARAAARTEVVEARRSGDRSVSPASFETQKVDRLPRIDIDALRHVLRMPESWRKLGDDAKGTIDFEVLVDTSGRFQKMTVPSDLGGVSLDVSFIEHIVASFRELRFVPGEVDGRPTTAWMRMGIDLSLDNFGGIRLPEESDRPLGAVADRAAPDIAIGSHVPVVAPRVRGEMRLKSDAPAFQPSAPTDAAAVEITDEQHREAREASRQMHEGTAEPIEVKLNRGEVFQVIAAGIRGSDADLTGTLVTSSKPVGVFSGHNCAYVPSTSVKACNLLVEQLPPTSTWGHTFGLGALEGRSRSVVRVIARDDDTQVMLDDTEVATLKAGEFFESANVQADALVITSKPSMVLQFAMGFDNGDDIGDPMMIVVPPLEQFDNVYAIATPVSGPWRHYVNVVAKSDAIAGIRIDDHPVDQTRFRPLGESGYAAGRLEISHGSHVVTGGAPFGLYQYGFGYDEAAYDAYGNAGGQLYVDLDAIEDGRTSDEGKPDLGAIEAR